MCIRDRLAGRQHLHAGDDDAVVLFTHDAQRRHRNILLVIEFRVARGLRGHHGIDHVIVVVADPPIVTLQIVGEGIGLGQRVGFHRHTRDERRHMVGRAAEHAEGEFGDHAMALHPPLQVVAALGPQEIDGVAATILLVGQGVAVRRIGLEVIDRGNGGGGIAEGGMAGDIVDALAADIDHATVAQRLEMLLA